MGLAVFQLAWLANKPQRYPCLPIFTNTGVTDVLTTTLGFYMDAEGLNLEIYTHIAYIFNLLSKFPANPFPDCRSTVAIHA